LQSKKLPIPFYRISVKSDKAVQNIFQSVVNSRMKPDGSLDRSDISNRSLDLSDITVGVSGSKDTGGTSGTIERVQNVRKKDMAPINIRFRA
jgi:hypothetical protein